MIFARKNYKIPEFYMIFARKMPEFYIIIAREIFFSEFWGARAPSAPVSYAYAFCTLFFSLNFDNRYLECNFLHFPSDVRCV